jgi:hypothetical protein
VLSMITECNIHNYSIYLRRLPDGNHYLFSYFEYTGALVRRSIDHWLGLKDEQGLQDRCGFTLGVAASQYASLEQGEGSPPFPAGLLEQ